MYPLRLLKVVPGDRLLLLPNLSSVREYRKQRKLIYIYLKRYPSAMAAPDDKKMKTCPNCGEVVPIKTKVCPNCGQILGSRRYKQPWIKELTATEIFLIILGSIMLAVFLVAL